MRVISVVIAFMIVLSLPVAGVTGISFAGGETELQNDLEREEKVQQYETYGIAPASIESVDVTIAKDSDDVDYDHFIVDSMNDFLRVDHQFEAEEEVEFYVPDDYFHPRPTSGLRPLEGGPEAELERVTIDGELYTKVSIEFDGGETVIYPVDRVAGSLFTVRYDAQDVIFNETPVPEPSNEEIWREKSIDRSEIGNGTTIVDATVGNENRTDITVVYEPDRSVLWGEKVPVPECNSPADRDNACVEEQRGGEAQILFKNIDTEEPVIMYKHDIGFVENAALSINDVAQIPDRIDIPFIGGDD